MNLPFVSQEVPSILGRIRSTPEDFRVEEVPLYLPTGEGDHLYVTFEKTSITTPVAVNAIAKAIGAEPREAGWAGLKDRHAVTVQTASFLFGDAAKALAIGDTLQGIRIVSAVRHRNKLKTGHLKGNRFVVTVRDCHADAVINAERVVARIRLIGIPNYYGAQRFGQRGDNATRALEWMTGRARAPRDPFLRKMLVSALQSAVFNHVVSRRVTDHTLGVYVDGDLAVRHPGENPFEITSEQATEDYPAHRCSATGPMPGAEMRWPARKALELEHEALQAVGLSVDARELSTAGKLARGTRRSVRLPIEDLSLESAEGNLRLSFILPSGGYATSVLREFRKTDEEGEAQDSSERSDANDDLHQA